MEIWKGLLVKIPAASGGVLDPSYAIKLRVKPAGELSRSVESVLVIATKEEVNFLSNGDLKEPTITDLMGELSELDPSLWAEKTVGYEVRK